KPVPSVATDLERKILAEIKDRSEQLKNLTYLCDVIGPRLTGSAALKRANDWGAERMKEYGLTNVHHEAWTMPECWKRRPAHCRVLEPDNGRGVHIASMAWTHGTNGKIQGDVVVLKATKVADLDAYKGKLKGAVVLQNPPTQLRPYEELDKGGF